MHSQNMKFLLFIMMGKKCEVNTLDYFVINSFKLENNALTKHLCLKNLLENLQRHIETKLNAEYFNIYF
jgi:hypothetical protein